jgi:hypothetical protein
MDAKEKQAIVSEVVMGVVATLVGIAATGLAIYGIGKTAYDEISHSAYQKGRRSVQEEISAKADEILRRTEAMEEMAKVAKAAVEEAARTARANGRQG